jgi:hypothetical protein
MKLICFLCSSPQHGVLHPLRPRAAIQVAVPFPVHGTVSEQVQLRQASFVSPDERHSKHAASDISA